MAAANAIQKYQKFLDDTLYPDYRSVSKRRDDMINEKNEYEALLVAVTKIMESKCTPIKARVNLGHHVFVNAEITKCDTVIVKMVDDVFAELNIERVSKFIEEKLKILDDRIGATEKVLGKIRAHIDLVLSSLNELNTNP